MERNETIKLIKAALKKRSGKSWSVTAGRGTIWGWLTISATPSKLENGRIVQADREQLAKLLDLDSVHPQGVSVPASIQHYLEFVNRAQGKKYTIAKNYWD